MSRMPDVGDVVDDVFHVEEELDHGNFGAIYRVHDSVEERTLALKIQKPGPHDEDEVRQRFEREARLIYSLDHHNVVEVMYYGETDEGLPYMAMEFLDGTDLKRLLRSGYDFQTDQIKRIALETLSALQAAHRIGIVHRDLKPANIFLVDDGKQGYVKVLDFGFAKSLDDKNNREITRAGTLVGSPAYMAPELVKKKNVGPHSDLYAMGLIMAEMVTGEKTIQIDDIYDAIRHQGSDNPVDLPQAVQESPFAAVVERAVQKNVERRYQSAEAMISDLDKIGGGTGADLQDHAEVESEHAAPFVVGSADQEADTQPRSHGMPSEQQVDEALADGERRDSRPNRRPSQANQSVDRTHGRRSSGQQAAVDERRRSSGQQAAVDERRRSSGQHAPVDNQRSSRSNRSPSSGGHRPVDRPSNHQPGASPGGGQPSPADAQRDSSSRAEQKKRTDNPGMHDMMRPDQMNEIDLEAERPAGGRDTATGGRSLLTEIALGIVVGLVILAVILGVLVFVG